MGITYWAIMDLMEKFKTAVQEGEERRAERRGTAESLSLLSLDRRARQTGEGAGGLHASAGWTCDTRVAQGGCWYVGNA